MKNCKASDIIPKFLNFRIPQNGCFDNSTVHTFQKSLLNKELIKAKEDLQNVQCKLELKRSALRDRVPVKCIPSIVLYTRLYRRDVRKRQAIIHNQKTGFSIRRTGTPFI